MNIIAITFFMTFLLSDPDTKNKVDFEAVPVAFEIVIYTDLALKIPFRRG